MIGVIIGAAGCAANVWMYADHHNPISLAAAIFCGILALANAVSVR